MTINGRQSDVTINDFQDVANNMEINKSAEIIEEIVDVVAMWPEFARQAEVKPEVSEYIGSLHLNSNTLASGISMR